MHLGSAAVSYGNALVGLYCIWHARPQPGDWFGYGTTSGDLGLVVSNDGIHFREPVKGHVYLAAGEDPVTPTPSREYQTILEQCNGILNVGDETRIYHGRWRNAQESEVQGEYGEVALATLPRDRWGSLGIFPDQTKGSAWSCPVTLPTSGCQVGLNADRARDMRIEVADERFNLLPVLAGEQSGVTRIEGGLDCPVVWPDGALTALGGATVRFRVCMKREGAAEPRLYAINLR